jgi:hypothetical protein
MKHQKAEEVLRFFSAIRDLMPACIRWARPLALAMAVTQTLACMPRMAYVDRTPIDTAGDPSQVESSDQPDINFSSSFVNYVLKPRATYSIRGIVMGRVNYGNDWLSDLSPCDVVIAWGRLAQGYPFREIKRSQSDRRYFWDAGNGIPYDNDLIVRNSSNNHIIPANYNLMKAAVSIKPGDMVEISGYLVNVEGTMNSIVAMDLFVFTNIWTRGLVWLKPDKTGFVRKCRWTTSLSREDTGDGACEIVYVTNIRIGSKVYK